MANKKRVGKSQPWQIRWNLALVNNSGLNYGGIDGVIWIVEFSYDNGTLIKAENGTLQMYDGGNDKLALFASDLVACSIKAIPTESFDYVIHTRKEIVNQIKQFKTILTRKTEDTIREDWVDLTKVKGDMIFLTTQPRTLQFVSI